MEKQTVLFDPEVLATKLRDVMTPGAVVAFNHVEAASVGAFMEEAIGESEALDSTCDLYSGELIGAELPKR